ncbi:LuxR C-terminal-related transcriptional regulator [Lysinibacter cavernae]|uniref:DNA-binding NarL/FixJ family response regulator n=1 Tax=Lysinibacter cavernae TaxID=1640652 RepID=A0A7X5R3M1_9MICO|nr:LuxR C-terminal-related transcriptional regulator [Lysinibacter cavernae]NIH55053.1 DNA-binding NarL/FixJ family response regulator [Lysinibacter cavernae]
MSIRIERNTVLTERRQSMVSDAVGRLISSTTLAICVVGPSGVGKTLLAQQIALGLVNDPSAILPIHCFEALSASPGAALAGALGLTTDGGLQPLLAAAGAALAGLATVGPVVLLVNNAEHLDQVSGAGLVQCARMPGVKLVITASDGARLPTALQQLWESGECERLDLGPFDVEESAEYLAGLFAERVTVGTIQRLFAATGGHPLLLREAVHDVAQSEQLHVSDGLVSLSDSADALGARLSDLVAARLARADDVVRQTTEILALAGPVPVSVIRQLVSDAQMDSILAGGFVERVVITVPCLHVRSEIAAEAIRNGLSIRVMREHFERFQNLLGSASHQPGFGIDRALWALACGAEITNAELFAAVHEASAVHRYESVITMTDEMLGRDGNLLDRSLLLMRAQALFVTGQERRSRRTLDSLVEAGDREGVMLAALVMHSAEETVSFFDTTSGRENVTRALDLLDERSVQFPEHEPSWSAYAAALLVRQGDTEVVEELLQAAENTKLPVHVRAEVCTHLSIALTLRGRPLLAQEYALRYLGFDFVSPDASPWLDGDLMHALSLAQFALGIPVQELTASGAGVDWNRVDLRFANLHAGAGLLCHDLGHAALALGEFRQGVLELAENDYSNIGSYVLAGAAGSAALLGNAELAAKYRTAAGTEWVGTARMVGAEARRLLLLPTLLCDGEAALAETGQQLVASLQSTGDMYAELRVLHDLFRFGVAVDLTRATALASAVEGQLADALELLFTGVVLQDADRLGRAVQAFLAGERQLYAAEAAVLQARVLLVAGDDRRAAESRAAATELLLPLGSVNTPILGRRWSDDDTLTSREQQIAELAARGSSNREIAEEMVLSQRTVEGHLQRVYAKLEIDGRAQLMPADARYPKVP